MRLLPLARAAALLIASTVCGCFVDAANGAPEEPNSVQPIAYTDLIVRPQNRADFDFAKIDARARVASISSGALAFGVRVIDDDTHTVFRFSGTDLHPTVVVELSEEEPLHRVSSVFDSEENIQLDVFLVNQLPKNLAQMQGAAVTCMKDPPQPNEAAADFVTTNARYVIYRWTRLKPSKSPFCVAEVRAFSSVRREQIPPTFADNEIHFTNETKVDFSNKLGTIADPPSLNVVSP
jgi:hypothetical protein